MTDDFDDDDLDNFDPEDLVTVLADDGTPVQCAVLGIGGFGDQEYALLTPVAQLLDAEGDEIEMYIFAYTATDDGGQFTEIEDEATYERVRAGFAESMGIGR